MDVDENVLIAEVARKRAVQSGDRETEEFVRRQQSQMRQQQSQQGSTEPDLTKPSSGGSSLDALEKELMTYLLKSGHMNYQLVESKQLVDVNIAQEIFQNLEIDGIELSDPVLREMFNTYKEHWKELGVGVKVPEQYFVNHPDPEVCNRAIDLLTEGENYEPSKLWKQKDIHVESEDEILAAGVPKSIMLYRSKVLDKMFVEQLERMGREDISEEEEQECLMILDKLNKARLAIAKRSERLIL